MALLAMLLYVTTLSGAAGGAELADQPAVRSMFVTLLTDARWGMASTEEAAFVIAGDDGRLSFVRWPGGEVNAATWVGDYPPHTVAIVHTHPNWLPMPSKIDAAAARRAHLPIYVITRWKITRTDGVSDRVVVDGEWN